MNRDLAPEALRVLQFWFGEVLTGEQMTARHRELWFGKNPATDRQIEEQFGALVSAAAGRELDAWEDHPAGLLAEIILLDQFSRNIFRGRPEAFANDALSLTLAREGIGRGFDRQLGPLPRVFYYLPLEHAEDSDVQQEAVRLFRCLVAEVPEAERKTFEGFLDYAIRHRDIIVRFGRFPHRNEILGRPSTAEELAFLSQPNSSF